MNVLFKNLPIGITAYDLSLIIESVFSESSADKKLLNIAVGSIEMLEIQDNFTRPIEQFGLVRISPPEVAKEVMRVLNGTVVKQYQIVVREYFIRSTKNDPRLKKIDNSGEFLEKSDKDRRQKNRLLKVRSGQDRRGQDRRINHDQVVNERRIKDRRNKERRINSLVYSRLI